MFSPNVVTRSRAFWYNLIELPKRGKVEGILSRSFAKKSDDGCSRAIVDIPAKVDPDCPQPCETRKKKKEGILHRIKLRMIEGGTNFGTPFRRLECTPPVCKKTAAVLKPKALPAPKKKVLPMPPARDGVQVSILGADTSIGQYVALLLKQCPSIKKLRLYEATETRCNVCYRDICNVAQDLHSIDTNCRVQAFTCSCCELERCLQNTDIVLMLESGYINVDMPLEKRFCYQAPMVKQYADCIATECPKAFVIVCASPIDCMVPLVAETMKETGWYDPTRLLGSLAVPEMRASTLAARALCLEPRYTRVPCVGGTEGDSLVPLFSKAVEYFDFATHNAMLMTDAVRQAPLAVARTDGPCLKAADLSEAHALAGLVNKVALAMLCKDVPRVTGFVETDASQVISPARYIANTVELGARGISKYIGLDRMNNNEVHLTDIAVVELNSKLVMVHEWYCQCIASSGRLDGFNTQFFTPRSYDRFDDCAYSNIFLAINVLLNNKGICKKLDFPPKLNAVELELLDKAFGQITYNINMALAYHATAKQEKLIKTCAGMQTIWGTTKHYDRLDDCTAHLV